MAGMGVLLLLVLALGARATTGLDSGVVDDLAGLPGAGGQGRGQGGDTATEKENRSGRPRSFQAEVLNSTTINLTWRPPRDTGATCPVKRYVLRLKQDGAKRSRAWKVDGTRKALGLHNLNSDSTYLLRLVAFTCKGRGKPSRWLQVHTEDKTTVATPALPQFRPVPTHQPSARENQPPGKPTYVRTRTYPESVMLSWRSPEESRVLVRGYMVGYGEGVPDVNWQYVDFTRNNLTIKNLKPSTQYIISLRAFNNFGKGPTVYDLIYTREESGDAAVSLSPVVPPSNIKAKMLSPTTSWLQWTDDSLGPAQQISDNRYYNVHYQAVPEGETLSVVVKALHVVLYDLSPGTQYDFRVRTVKDAFYSNFSVTVRNKTFETAPGSPPRSLLALPTNDSHAVHVSWRIPKQPNGKVTGYLVLHTVNREEVVGDWDAMATTDTEVLITGLRTNTTYYFKVQARNSVGYGPLSRVVALTTSDRPFVATEGLHIMPDDHPDVQESSEDYTDENWGTSDLQAGYDFTLTREGNDTVPGSSKNKRHNSYHVGGTAEAGGSPRAEPHTSAAVASTPGSKHLKFKVKLHHSITAYVTWAERPSGRGCSTSTPQLPSIKYVLRHYPAGQQSEAKLQLLDVNMAVIDDIMLNEDYFYQVKYVFPNGLESEWSEPQPLSTHCGDMK